MEKEPIKYLMVAGTLAKESKLLSPTFVLPKGDWWLVKGNLLRGEDGTVCLEFEGYPLNNLSLNEIKAVSLLINEPLNSLWIYGYENIPNMLFRCKRSLIDLANLKTYYVLCTETHEFKSEELIDLKTTQTTFRINVAY